VALVIGTDASAVSLTKTVLEYLRSKGVKKNAFFPILNRAVGLEGMSKPDVEKFLDIEIRMSMPYLGSHLAMANDQHIPFALKFPKDAATVVLRDGAYQVADSARRQRSNKESHL
jgi:hypothetical protein